MLNLLLADLSCTRNSWNTCYNDDGDAILDLFYFLLLVVILSHTHHASLGRFLVTLYTRTVYDICMYTYTYVHSIYFKFKPFFKKKNPRDSKHAPQFILFLQSIPDSEHVYATGQTIALMYLLFRSIFAALDVMLSIGS